MMERLFLFDIDGTLLSAQGAGKRAVRQALETVYGQAGPVDAYDFHGKTDPQIVEDLMTAAGLAPDRVRRHLPEFFTIYLQALEREVGNGERVRLYPGVGEVVRTLAKRDDLLVGLLTGNIEAGARIKITPTGLWPCFRLGAYGSDSADRTELPAVAARRAQALAGRPFSGRDVVIVGDTPLDIACARAYGAMACAVATGRHGVDELAAHAPDMLFPDFSRVDLVLHALLNGPRS